MIWFLMLAYSLPQAKKKWLILYIPYVYSWPKKNIEARVVTSLNPRSLHSPALKVPEYFLAY
jgi:hypothetical protein